MTKSSQSQARQAFVKASEGVPSVRPIEARPKSPVPFSLRLSWEERERLEKMAGRRSLGAFIRQKLFGETVTARRERRKPRPDDVAIAQALAALGTTRIASNLNQIAKAANTGTLPVDPDLAEELSGACADVRAMKNALIESLGLKAEDSQ